MSADSVAAASVASIGNNDSLFALLGLAFFCVLIAFFCMVGGFFLICGLIWFSSGGSDSSAGGRERSSSWWYSYFWWIPGKGVTPRDSGITVDLHEKKDVVKDDFKATGKEEIAALKKEIDALKSRLANVEGQNILSLQNSVLELFESVKGMKHSFKCSNGQISSCNKVISELTSRIKVIETYLGENFHNRTNKDFFAKYRREATIDDNDLSNRVNLIYSNLDKLLVQSSTNVTNVCAQEKEEKSK